VRTRYGKIDVAKTHTFSEPTLGTRTSPYLQEKLTLLGAYQVFSEVPKLVDSLLGIAVSESQAYRCVQAVSEVIEDPYSASVELKEIQADAGQQVYGMVDGSFLSLDEGWKEIKVGRVFKATPTDSIAPDWEMGQSEYVAHRGHYETFTRSFETLLPPESRCRKVFITDGASWITNWLTSVYPNSLQILDFFHVCEKLATVPQLTRCSKDWFERHKALLLSGSVDIVCSSIRSLKAFTGKNELLAYLEKNAFRMKYDEYREQKLMISSGPIESAHRTVLQTRMKRSGQRWSNGGCDSMVKLRVAYSSGKSSLVTNVLLKRAA
jgi:Uncharacterised protein family (UPF0236)